MESGGGRTFPVGLRLVSNIPSSCYGTLSVTLQFCNDVETVRLRSVKNLWKEPHRAVFSNPKRLLRHGDLYCMVAGGAGRDGGGLILGLGLSLAVGGPDLYRVFAGLRIPLVDVLTPGVHV